MPDSRRALPADSLRRHRRLSLEHLEDRTLLSNWFRVADVDGFVADANLDAVFDTVNTTGTLVQTTSIPSGPTIDQSNTASPWTNYNISASSNRPIGQEFVPTSSGLNYVDLRVADAGSDIGPGANFQVRIRSGSITGTILATSATSFVADGTNTGGGSTWTRFNFGSTVALTPGATHVIEIIQLTTGTGVLNYMLTADEPTTDTYSAGRAIVGGSALTTNADFLFKEGMSVAQTGASERGVLEFDTTGVPRNSVITSARITGTVNRTDANVDVGFYGYAGNGSITTADANASQTRFGRLVNPATGAFSVDLDPAWVQSILRSANYPGYLGFVVKLASGQYFDIDSTEGVEIGEPTLVIDYDDTNFAPTATNNTYVFTRTQQMLTVSAPGVLGNDTDANGDILTASLVSNPTYGQVSLGSNGAFVYTPFAGATPTSDTFTYKANDALLDSNVATVTINFNDAPVAVNDGYSVNEDTTLNVLSPGVLGNDYDPNGDGFTFSLVSTTAHGLLTFNYTSASFTYRPNANFNGIDSFTYRIYDGYTYSSIATATITVNPVNDTPVASNNSYNTAEDTPLNVTGSGILGNDTDIDGDTLSAILVTNVTKGSLSLNADGTFTYTPNANVTGTDSFTYRANDGTVNSNTATVTITITAVNDAPIARDDTVNVHRGATLNIQQPGVMINDSDVEGSPLTATLVSGASHGSVTLNSNGSFVYTPELGYVGQDTFTYKVRDGALDSNVATVTINVQDINDVPVALGNSYSTNQDTTLNVVAPGILANDYDPNRDPITAVLVSTTTSGQLSLNADGSFLYTPNAGFMGNDSFVYRVNDGITDGTSAIVTIRVNGVPVANNDAYTINEDVFLSIPTPGVKANDSDPNNDPLTVIKVSDPTKGFLSLNANGSFTYSPFTNANGIDTFRYKLNDGYGDSNIATVTITINPVNDPPFANANGYSVAEDGVLNVTGTGVLGNDTDAEGDPMTAEVVTGPTNGSLNFNSNGTFVYTPNANFHGTDIFTYRATDGTAYSQAVNVQITVTRVNDAPTAVDDAFTMDEDTTLNFTAGTPVTYIYLNSQPGDYIGQGQTKTFTPSTGTISSSSAVDNVVNVTYFDTLNSGVWWYFYFASPWDTTLTPGTYLNATRYPFQLDSVPGLSVSGEGRGSNGLTGQFTVLQAEYNQQGRIVRFAANFEQHSEGATPALFGEVRYNYLANTPGLLANDRDTESNALSAILVTGPSHGDLSLNADGTFRYTPDADFIGVDTFTYKVNDGALDSNVATVRITVNNANDDPVVANNDSYTLDEDVPLAIAGAGVLANDVNVDNDPLTVSVVTGPTNGSLQLNANGTFTYTPNVNYNGTDSFTYRVNDTHTNSNVATVLLTINALNDVPVATNDSYTIDEDGSLTVPAPGILANDSDVEGSPLTITLLSNPASGSLLLNANGSFSYTPVANFNGNTSFTYRINDGSADSNIATVNITVTPVNDEPVAEAGPNLSGGEMLPIAFNGAGSSDVDGDALTYSWDFGDGQAGSGATPTHAYADNGEYLVRLTVNDGRGGQHSDTMTVSVTNRLPVASINAPSAGVRGQRQTVTVGAADPSTVDQAAGFTFLINWGDGTSSEVSGASGQVASHVYTANGNYQVQVTARDKDGGEDAETHSIAISSALVQDRVLVVGGTTSDDTIVISPVDSLGNLKVVINGAQQGTTYLVSEITVYGQAGNDSITLASARIGNRTYTVNDPAILFGDDGNDTLDTRGSSASNILLGGAGDDQLLAGGGRDLLFGGYGADLLRGGAGDDLLIGGITDFDADPVALNALRAEWNQSTSYSSRIQNLSAGGGLNGTYRLTAATIHDDGAIDQLYGEGQTDWFLYAAEGAMADLLKDKKGDENASAT